jgi:hypothetical protein
MHEYSNILGVKSVD